MGTVIYQSRNVVFWHLGELLLENALEARQDDKTLSSVVVIDDAKLDLAIALLCDSRLGCVLDVTSYQLD